ncbi:MAG: pyridoxine 5'-phosphate synthase [Candidatus Omnitrophica bacterium]|nr:pyridoxine 5'-phosphate synthase [Candidatus Omnitrophota bacterium]MCM8800187.1 pyridoxine 5'-phosphate synthase [Candidatus Omnitrophota bacterium]
MPKLGVNIDHIATLREVRHGKEPQPVFAALICEANGADSIVVHLREDRRHIKETDLYLLKKVIKTKLNLEMSLAKDIVKIASRVKPDQATLVPERRQELTTEGGLDLISNFRKVKETVKILNSEGINVSLFIDPDKRQIDMAKKLSVNMIELHTGRYAEAKNIKEQDRYYNEILESANYASSLGMVVNAGHGLDYYNVSRIAKIKVIEELNIGYSIVCRAVIVGLACAVKEMKALIQ